MSSPSPAGRAARDAYDSLALAVGLAHAPAAFTLGGLVGRLAGNLRRYSAAPSELSALFPKMARARLAPLAREIAANYFRNRVLIVLLRRSGIESLARFVECEGAENLGLGEPGRSAVLVTWHVGPVFAIAPALHRLGLSALVVREGPFYPPPPDWEVAVTRGPLEQRTLVLRRALERLRAGGVVLGALDGVHGSSTAPVSCLGRLVAFSRGPLWLARRARAPLVPVVARWRPGGRILFRADAPLWRPRECGGPDPSEDALAACAARWLEAYLRRVPEELWPSTVRWLLNAPLAAG